MLELVIESRSRLWTQCCPPSIAAIVVCLAVAGCGGAKPTAERPAKPRTPRPVDLNDKSPVRLSAGAGQPQQTPAGPAMSFSVEYQVTQSLNTSARSLLVIETGNGKRSGQPTQLERSGTLKVLVNGWKPEDGPFEAYVEEVSRDGKRRPLSVPVSLE